VVLAPVLAMIKSLGRTNSTSETWGLRGVFPLTAVVGSDPCHSSRPDGVFAMREPDLSSDGPAKLPDGGKLSERDRRLAHVVWGYDARDARSWRAWNEVDYAEPRAGSAHGKGGSHRVDRQRRMAANFNLHGSNAVHDRRADVDYRRFRSRPTPGEHLPAERRNGHHQRKRSNNRPIRCHDPPIVAASRAARWLSRSHREVSLPCATCPLQSIGTRYVAATAKFVAIFHAAAGDRGHRSTRAAAPVRLPVPRRPALASTWEPTQLHPGR
jgi:hypothetical protein